VRWFRQFLKKILPGRTVNWIRRWRATGRYLRSVSEEVLERDSHLEDLERRIAGSEDGFYQRLVKDVVERTEVVVQQLDRRIEGQGARHSELLRQLEGDLRSLREEVARLREAVQELQGRPDGPATERRASRGRRVRASD
jgi:chromosome segregation ATPase